MSYKRLAAGLTARISPFLMRCLACIEAFHVAGVWCAFWAAKSNLDTVYTLGSCG